jgi:hypothetical protein
MGEHLTRKEVQKSYGIYPQPIVSFDGNRMARAGRALIPAIDAAKIKKAGAIARLFRLREILFLSLHQLSGAVIPEERRNEYAEYHCDDHRDIWKGFTRTVHWRRRNG